MYHVLIIICGNTQGNAISSITYASLDTEKKKKVYLHLILYIVYT